MKHIQKGNAPKSLEDWIVGQKEAEIAPAYGDLQNPEKGHCRTELVAEQGGLCCYCNREISEADMHIEHLQTQTAHPELGVEWSNMLGCCKPQQLKGKHLQTQVHCGEFRGEKDVGVSPLDPNCETHFAYTLEGNIQVSSSNDLDGNLAIANLNLGAERLRSAREKVIREAYADIDTLSEAEWLAVYVERSQGTFQEFAAMLRWFYDTSWSLEF